MSEADLAEGVKTLATLHHGQAKAPRTVIPISERTATEQPQFIHNKDNLRDEDQTVKAHNLLNS